MASELLVVGTGGTIDKDYPRSTRGYAFEIDEPAAARILDDMRYLTVHYRVESVCKKDSTEITDDDRERLVAVIRTSTERRVLVTHGTDTMIETARYLLKSGAAAGKVIAFTGAMKPERFKDSDAGFNVGAAVGVTDVLPLGTVVVVMGGRAIPCSRCIRDLETGRFVDGGATRAEAWEGGTGKARMATAGGAVGAGDSTFLEAVLTHLRPAAMQHALSTWSRAAAALQAESARAAHSASALQGKWAMQKAFHLEAASAGRLIRGVLRWWQNGDLQRCWGIWREAMRAPALHSFLYDDEANSPHVTVSLA